MKHPETGCEAVRTQLAMLLYGELSIEEEERVESHLDICADCRFALQRERRAHAAIDHAAAIPPPSLLYDCRDGLSLRLEREELPRAPGDFWNRWIPARILRPVGAMALIAIGFAGARLWPAAQSTKPLAGTERVREIEAAPNGSLRIVVDETRQRVISGRVEDPQVRGLLLSTAKDSLDPGLRAETVDILHTRAASAGIRDALAWTLQHDPNAGVRMKALEGLKPFAAEPEVRAALAQVLLKDANSGLRTQAIDLLTADADGNLDRDVVGTLQELVERGEQPGYVRDRCLSVLQAVNASAELY